MAEPDYRAMLVALCEAVEKHDRWSDDTVDWPAAVEVWWENDPELRRHRAAAKAAQERRDIIRRVERELQDARRAKEAAEVELAGWRFAQSDPEGWTATNAAAAEKKLARVSGMVAEMERTIKNLSADTPSAQPEPQAADPERVVADLDASIPHPAPQ